MKLKNRFSLFRNSRPIKLYYYRHKDPLLKNFGDELSKEIVEKLSGRKVAWANVNECGMVSIGSVLHYVLQRKSKNKVVVWGSGLMFDDSSIRYKSKLNKFHLVRGKLSAKNLNLKINKFGDPGLIVDQLYRPSKNRKKVGIVPHYVDKQNPITEKISKNKDIKIINVLDSPAEVISEIAACELIISSSLHGIITAHSFGIPAYWIEFSDMVAGDGFKFRDYYSIFEKEPLKIEKNVLNNLIKKADDLINRYEPLATDRLKKDILSSFPKDSL